MRTTALIFVAVATVADAFQLPSHAMGRAFVVLGADGTGGWGIGNSREMVPEEFAKGSRKPAQGYELQDRGAFMRKIGEEREDFKKSEMEELLAVAQIAGIKVKDPKERLSKFEDDLLNDEDDLDVTI
jgi:hypothetical protein